MTIKEWIHELNIHPGSVVSMVGCGGKTSLLKSFAEALAEDYKVCAATTTHIRMPRVGSYKDLFIRHKHECVQMPKENGIYYFADEVTSDKLHEFSAYMLSLAKAYTDVVLIEADGSKEKPLKGWAEFEPVILEDTTITIGVLTLGEIGNIANDANVHRMSIFEKQTGILEGQVITEEAICQLINRPDCLFKDSKQRKVLFINKIDTEQDYYKAIDFVSNHWLNVDEIYIGSLKFDTIERFR